MRSPWLPAVRAALLLGLAGACSAPEKEGSLAEIGQMMKDAKPVHGSAVEGAEPLVADAFALRTPEEVAAAAAAAPAAASQDQGDQGAPEALVRQDPYIRFGERIIVRTDELGHTYITKPYTMPVGKAEGLVKLMGALDPFPFRPRPTAEGVAEPLHYDPTFLEFEVLPGWDEEAYANLKLPSDSGIGAPPAAATPVKLSDLLVITATYDRLEEFEAFLDLFAAAGIPQVELEAKIIEVVESDQLDIGSKSSFVFGDSNFVQSVDFDLSNVTGGAAALLDLGAVQSSFAFDAVLQAIRTWDNVQIDSRPKTVVRAGGVAYLESTTEIPFFEIKTLDTAGNFSTNTVYKKVGVQLYISPRVIGTKTLALDVHLVGSQQVGSQATFTVQSPGAGSGQDTVIEVPVIAYRTAKTVVYLEPGQTLVIGGLTTQRDRELVNKVPILGDLPLLGFLFRSKFTRTDKQHVLFAISPRILQHSDFEEEF